MWEQVDELGGFAAVGDEEQCVVLRFALALSHSIDNYHFLGGILDRIVILTSRTSPRSPCAASQACMKLAATPMDLHVATSFCPM